MGRHFGGFGDGGCEGVESWFRAEDGWHWDGVVDMIL